MRWLGAEVPAYKHLQGCFALSGTAQTCWQRWRATTAAAAALRCAPSPPPAGACPAPANYNFFPHQDVWKGATFTGGPCLLWTRCLRCGASLPLGGATAVRPAEEVRRASLAGRAALQPSSCAASRPAPQAGPCAQNPTCLSPPRPAPITLQTFSPAPNALWRTWPASAPRSAPTAGASTPRAPSSA